MTLTEGDLLWEPTSDDVARAPLTRYQQWLRERRDLDLSTYDDLWQWSVDDLPAFWSSMVEFFDVRLHAGYDTVLASREMPSAEWFPGATLNYAERALAAGADDAIAFDFTREDGLTQRLTFADLRREVAAVAAALRDLGVGKGDRVAALVPNCPVAPVAFLATVSLGAVWSSCSPDFGARSVADRFGQIEPTVLIAVDGYIYNGKRFDIRDTVERLRRQMPSLQATVLVPYLDETATLDGARSWPDVLATEADDTPHCEPLAFDHPLWILYSSGTTGLPKPIVQGHGGILLEHLKSLSLQMGLGPDDVFFWFTTTGWMMWNLLVSGIAVGATVVLYDGSPAAPDLRRLWQLAADTGMTYFGTSAPYIASCMKAGLRPSREHDLSALRAVGSTGAPLSPEGFLWLAHEVGESVQPASLSGGTDVCTAFVGAAPTLPVYVGEISCRALGADVEAFDEDGKPVVDEVGELVVTAPMPSMPLYFIGDSDGSRLREAYYADFPGVWRHGDWIKITARGTCVIYGRSDSTLNRGGVRMGTAEFYNVVEDIDGVEDSLVVDTSAAGVAEGKLLLFVVVSDGASIDDVTAKVRDDVRRELSPRHVPDDVIEVPAIPRTLNGKKCEVPVKRILAGTPVDKAVSPGALRDPEALQPFVEMAAGR